MVRLLPSESNHNAPSHTVFVSSRREPLGPLVFCDVPLNQSCSSFQVSVNSVGSFVLRSFTFSITNESKWPLSMAVSPLIFLSCRLFKPMSRFLRSTCCLFWVPMRGIGTFAPESMFKPCRPMFSLFMSNFSNSMLSDHIFLIFRVSIFKLKSSRPTPTSEMSTLKFLKCFKSNWPTSTISIFIGPKAAGCETSGGSPQLTPGSGPMCFTSRLLDSISSSSKLNF